MKTTMAIVLMVAFGLLLIPSAFAQSGQEITRQKQADELARSPGGDFKGEVVSCDPAMDTCTVKLDDGQVKTGSMTYASYQGGFEAAKELQPGDRITGKWQNYKGKTYAVNISKQ